MLNSRLVSTHPYNNQIVTETSKNRSKKIFKLYVGNLSWDVTWQDLKDHFKQCGNVVRADVVDGPDGRSKGYGLVEYSDWRDANRAMTTLNDTVINGRQIFVREDRESGVNSNANSNANSSQQGVGRVNKLYVGNLSWDVTWQDLKDHFKQCGNVVRADVVDGPDGRSKGYGLVEYSDWRDAIRAMMTLNDTVINGRQIFVREDREA